MTNGGVMIDAFSLGGGNPSGSIAARLLANNMDMNVCRPYIAEDGRGYITVNTGTVHEPKYEMRPVANGLLRQDQWRLIDQAIVAVSKPTMRAVADLRAAGLVKVVDGMSTPVISYETRSDITGATISMNGLREGEKDRSELGIVNMPLPIIHKDTSFDLRNMRQAERGGLAIDTTWIEDATIRVLETAEDMLLGTIAAYVFTAGTGAVYGYRTLPTRLTKTLTLPTSNGWTPQTLLDEVLDMRQSLRNKFRSGPYVLYFSTNWDPYLDNLFSSAYNSGTLREQLLKIEGVTAVRTLDRLGLSAYQILMIEMQKRTVQEVVGMDVRALQWEEKGGMELVIKIMAILSPQLRTDFDGNIGIMHGTAA